MAHLPNTLVLFSRFFQQLILLMILVMILTGCTTISTTVRETQGHLNQWINQPVNYLIDRSGLPDEVIRMDNKSISHIKKESWDSSYGLFAEIDASINARKWNDQISAWILLYRHEEQRLDGNYYACTQTYHVNHRGIIIGVKEGWTSPDSQNPCYIKYNTPEQRIVTARSQIENNQR